MKAFESSFVLRAQRTALHTRNNSSEEHATDIIHGASQSVVFIDITRQTARSVKKDFTGDIPTWVESCTIFQQ